MSAKYRVIERGKPGDPLAPTKYYPIVVNPGRTGSRELARKLSAMSTVSAPDMMAMIEGMLSTIPDELAMGNIVDLGEFGTFRLFVRSEGSDTPEAVTRKNISKVAVRFTPGKAFREMLSGIKFEKIR